MSNNDYDDLVLKNLIKQLTDLKTLKNVSINDISNLIIKYNTCRLDIKNEGNSSNDIQVTDCSDWDVEITNPSWYFNSKGKGTVVHSKIGTLYLEFICINSGNLNLTLRGVDYKDSENNRCPVYIEYSKFKIDDKIIFDKPHLICHDKPFTYNTTVFNGQKIKIELKWNTLNYNNSHLSSNKNNKFINTRLSNNEKYKQRNLILDSDDIMDEFNLVEKKFFIIDSDNLENIGSKLYGFFISDDEIIYDETRGFKEIKPCCDGTYIFIEKDDNYIKIYQDFLGSYGIHIYENKNKFVISNSFVKLVEYLKNREILTFNEELANSLITCDLCTLSINQTLVNEIKLVPRGCTVKINIEKNKLEYIKHDLKENTIDVNSKEYFETLDKWYFKWVNRFRLLKKHTNDITVDVSGGFDTRVILALILSSNLNLDEINFNSIKDDRHTHKEDYEIASMIAEEFNFKLNKGLKREIKYFKNFESIINLSAYVKFGFHKQLYYKNGIYVKPSYRITGMGGETIRTYWTYSKEEYMNKCLKRANNYSPQLVDSTKNIVSDSINYVESKFSGYLSSLLYKENRNRIHFGRGCVEDYLANIISFCPIMDKDLQKLKLENDKCKDTNLLISLIFVRYCPDLLKFKFDNNRFISPETIDYAKKLNAKYPFKSKMMKKISNTHKNRDNAINNGSYLNPKQSDLVFKKYFYSNAFQEKFLKKYDYNLYKKIEYQINNTTHFPLQDAITIISIIKIMNDCEYSEFKSMKNPGNWLTNQIKNIPDFNSNLLNYNFKLNKYTQCRIDLKNIYAENNKIEIIKSNDDKLMFNSPKWFKNEKGIGTVVHTYQNKLKMSIKCYGNGELNIWIRSRDYRDEENNRIPVYISASKLKIDNEVTFNEREIVTHDKPLLFKKQVINEEVVNIELEWNLI